MLRFVVILLAAILLISFLRSIIGILIKAFAAVINSNEPSPATSARQAAVPSSSELKKDPVCGTYVPVATSVKKTVAGSVVHFCSTDCRDKYRG